MMDSDVIGNPPLRYRDDGSANNRHDHDSGTVACQGSEFGHTQCEDAGEHDRVKEPDQNDGVHGNLPGR